MANGGNAYVFLWNGSSWVQEQKFAHSTTAAGDSFGVDVDINYAGDTIAVGAYYDDNGGANAGVTFVFTRSGTTWSAQAALSNNTSAGDHFGYAVALSNDGNTLVATSPDDDWPGAGIYAGSCPVFTRSGTTWSLQQWLKIGEIGGRLGSDVDISNDGNTIIIAEAGKDVLGTNANAGAAHMLTRSGTTWSKVTTFYPSDQASGDYFGYAVAVSGDASTAVVGDPWLPRVVMQGQSTYSHVSRSEIYVGVAPDKM